MRTFLVASVAVADAKLTNGGLLRKQQYMSVVVKDDPHKFETLAECQEGYNQCMGFLHPVSTEPDYVAPPTTTTTTRAPLMKADIGEPQKSEAVVAYKPPMADGTPDQKKGWDHNEHGADWPEECHVDGQSPIDIEKYVDIKGQTKSVLWFDYYQDPDLTVASEGHLSNDGHGLFYSEPQFDMGYVKIGTAEYEAFEYVIHTPSEHTIDGQVYPMELQVMHKDADGKVLAVSILFKYGLTNAFLAAIKEAVPSMPAWSTEKGAQRKAVSGSHPDFFNIEHILPKGDTHPGGDMTFYNYGGSLTMPPCTGGVSWWVTAEPVEATKAELAQFRDAIIGAESTKSGNNRAVQAVGDREVLVGHTGFQHHIKHHGHKADVKPDSRGYSSQDTPWKPEEKKEEAKKEEAKKF